MQRALLTDFALKNPYYAAASVTVYEVNENLQQTATVATLYAGPIGATLRPNPIALDSEGKFPGPIYVEKPVIMVVTPAGGPAQVLGVTGLIPRWRGIWTSATLYYPSERVRDPAGPSTFIVLDGHVSNSFSVDLAAGLLQEEIDADAMTDALAADVLGTVIPVTPASAFLRVNAGANGIETRTPAQVRGDIAAVNRGGDTMQGALLLPGFDPVAANEATRKAYVDALVAAVIAQARRPGEITAFAMSSAPSGWLFCDGSAVSRTTYAALFLAIGTTHGVGDGATTFNLPDYRGAFLRGFDAGRGLDPGRVFASYQGDAFESHGHTITDPGHQHWSGVNNGGGGDYFGASAPANPTNSATNRYSLLGGLTSNTSHLTSFSPTGITISNAGGSETRPKNVAVYICIKT
ncbi:MAG: phage tail protein [Opitutia bacterium]